MVSRKVANRIEIIEFVLFVMAHAIYAFCSDGIGGGMIVFTYAALTSLAAGVSLYCVKNLIHSQVCFIICVMTATYLIGICMNTLTYGVCIYMVAGALISILGNMRLNLYYDLIVNIAIVFGLATQYDVITSNTGIGYYVLMILFCEAALITECMMGLFCQRKIEQMEIQNSLLNIAQKSKDEFLANMSHEIRTPMNAIIGMSELIMRDPDATGTIRENCYNIQTSGENLLAIINDILDFSKIESGKMDIKEEEYSIVSMLQDVVNTAVLRKGYKDIELIFDASPNLPRILYGDVVRNRQILINIVNNAVKFTTRGYVYVAISCVEENGQNWLKMLVEDTGIGMKEEDQAHLFESFCRFDETKNQSVEGTGLGLVICKRLIEAMGGNIHIDSVYEKGTTVTVCIPQEIRDHAPFLKLKTDEKIRVALFGDVVQYDRHGDERYLQMNANFWNALKVPYETVTDFTTLKEKLSRGEFTHVISGMQEYTDHREEWRYLSDSINVFVVCNSNHPARLDENICGVRIPYYSVNLVSALNGESFYRQQIDESAVAIQFQAPSARVLVVDDNEINLLVADGVLKLYNLDVVLVSSGKEALKVLEQQDIDLVLMDHMMPEMDGIETVRIFRAMGGEYEKNLPIIAQTANAVNRAEELFLQNGFQDFLAKPVTLQAMDAMLRKWLPEEKLEWKQEACMQIDERKALENLGQQRDIYKELLEYSLELEQERWKEIQDSFEKEQFKDYEIHVHALKGAMRSLGVEEMAQLCEETEHACKAGDYEMVKNTYEQLEEEYKRAHRSIAAYLKNYHV